MTPIEFIEPDSDAWKQWKRKCEDAAKELAKTWKPGTTPNVTDLYTKMKDVYEEIFKGKCAFCESLIVDVTYAHIEHFRPKKGIDGDDNKPVKITIDGVTIDHPGYFWLAYDHRNLLLACHRCNVSGKQNYFPLANGAHALPFQDIAGESPLFLNPTDPGFNPCDHFEADLESGELKGKSPEGEACEKILRLNRERVPDERKARADEAQAQLAILAFQAGNKDDMAKAKGKIYDHEWGKKEHTFFVRQALEEARERIRANIG